MRLCAPGVGTISGRLLLGTAEIIPSSELVDTTGAGDAFIGAILYGAWSPLCSSFVAFSHHLLMFCASSIKYFSYFLTSQKLPFNKPLLTYGALPLDLPCY